MLLTLAVFLLIIPSLVFAQSKETGALKGTITLEDGSPVPGVLVTLASGEVVGAAKTTITNDAGLYRFMGLQPGTYIISASLEGFSSAKQTGISIHIGKTFTVDLVMKQGKITEEVVVMGKTALVDVKESATATVEMTSDYLQNIPNSQFTTNAVNLAPGISGDVAYGAASSTGILYQIDGVDVSDPAGGSSWVFLDYDVVDEVSISGIGAPAEYGGFTGVVFNTVTKSGGNQYKGYMDALYQNDKWNSKNSTTFTPSKTMFYSVHADVGGPIIKDKLSFFLSGLLYRDKTQLSGTTYDLDYKQPKGFLKLSWQPSKKTRVHSFIEVDTYDGSGRGGGKLVDQAATVDQESPELVANLSFQHLFSDYTIMEGKIAYFDGYFALEPHSGRDIPGHYDYSDNTSTINANTFYKGDRTRMQGNFSVTHHAEDFIKGNHDFKFGTDIIMATQRDQGGYPGGKFYGDYFGEPYLRWDYEGYDINANLNTYSFYAQDSWSISDRLTINPGVRFDLSRGGVDDLPGTEYKTKGAFAPRIGFTFDVFGDHSTALKGHWGRYYEGAYIYSFRNLSKSKGDYSESIFWEGEWYLNYTIPGNTSNYTIDDNLKQQYMDQWTVGVERQLMKDFSLGVTFIHRRNYNQMGTINITGEYEKVKWTDNLYSNKTYDLWIQQNSPGENIYLITNPEPGDFPWIETPLWRKYIGLEVLLNKRFSHNWQMMMSYVWSKATGTVGNTFGNGYGGNSTYANPNNQINSEGRLGTDPTHMLKIQGTVILPFDINFNGNFSVISGNTYTPLVRVPLSVDPNRSVIYAESRGSYRYPTYVNLDLRLEKTFKLGGTTKIGFLVDIFNVFNAATVNGYNTYLSSWQQVTSIRSPRSYRAGFRLWF